MTTKRKITRLPLAILGVFLILASCNKEDIPDQNVLEEADIEVSSEDNLPEDPAVSVDGNSNDNTRTNPFNLRVINRYYAGGSQSVHSYRYSTLGCSLGSYEGGAFTTWVSNQAPSSRPYNVGAFREAYFLIAPGNRDYIITVSSSERASLKRSGWRDCTRLLGLMQKYRSVGTRALYRFYNAQATDHLFTVNYSEGVNAGYRYEGIVGYVR